MHFELQTRATPEELLRALTDFSERRPKVWNCTLDARTYELRELGDTSALARESTARSPFWVVERRESILASVSVVPGRRRGAPPSAGRYRPTPSSASGPPPPGDNLSRFSKQPAAKI